MKELYDIRIDFSLKREVFFVVIGAVVGAVTMIVPRIIFEAHMGLPYYLTWIAFGHIVGIYSSYSVLAGITIHMITAICIGITIGIFLYKTGNSVQKKGLISTLKHFQNIVHYRYLIIDFMACG